MSEFLALKTFVLLAACALGIYC